MHFQKALTAHAGVLQPSAAELELDDAASRHHPLLLRDCVKSMECGRSVAQRALSLVQGMTPTSVQNKSTRDVPPSRSKMVLMISWFDGLMARAVSRTLDRLGAICAANGECIFK